MVSLWLIPPAGTWTLLQKGTQSFTVGTMKNLTVKRTKRGLKFTVKVKEMGQKRYLRIPAKQQQQQQREVGGAGGSHCSRAGSSSGDGSGATTAASSSSSSVRVRHGLLMRSRILILSCGGRSVTLLLLLGPAAAGSSSRTRVVSCRGSKVGVGGCRRALSAGTSC